jgi:hypothetical protein
VITSFYLIRQIPSAIDKPKIKPMMKELCMGGFKEYGRYDGLGLAELVKKKDVSAAEICEEAITRIERVNPTLNAVITPMYDLARQAVQASRTVSWLSAISKPAW